MEDIRNCLSLSLTLYPKINKILMSRHKRDFNFFRPKSPSRQVRSTLILLDQFSVADIHKWTAYKDKFLKYHWDYYSELAFQRSKILDKIEETLRVAAQRNFSFKNWQHSVKYRYSNDPLSVRGSLIDPGGRFNIGDINPSQFPIFPALYIASDKDTAIQELLNQNICPTHNYTKLGSLELALTSPESISIVSVSGLLDSIINLKEPSNLEPFVDLIKDFTVPEYLKEAAKNIGEREPELIRSVPKLIESLMDSDWRVWPMNFDVPIASQIFGQLVSSSGIEGILYTSKFTSSDCLAIFPQNFDENSFVKLGDSIPEATKISQLDRKTWNENKARWCCAQNAPI